MSNADQLRPSDIVRFYLEAGVDAALLDEPVNRLTEVKIKHDVAASVKSPLIASQVVPHVDPATAQTLEELKTLIETFEGCGLKKTATQTVFADGVAGSRVMLLGEAPSRDDDINGRPFTGKSGQLLDLMLKSVGLDRNSVYMAHSVYWRTPGNRQPTTEESMQCLPFVKRQIELANPEILVLLGGVSAKTLLSNTAGIMQLRGQWTKVLIPGLGELPAMPTLTPDYLLRNLGHKRLAWADWLLLKAQLKN